MTADLLIMRRAGRPRWGAHGASIFLLLGLSCGLPLGAAAGERARDWSIPFAGRPGPLNAITDIAGVEVGQRTVEGPTAPAGSHTGVTVVFPRGRTSAEGVSAAVFSFNGTGELTGSHLIDEIGAFYGPVALTGTLNVGVASTAILQWTRRAIADPEARYSRVLPVVGETWDGDLSDAWSFPLKAEDVVKALEDARGGPVEEGGVGGGTGMVAHDFKAGIGTASRRIALGGATYTVGALVQANEGERETLTIAGVPVGRKIADLLPERGGRPPPQKSSIIVLVGTDAPLDSRALARVAKRATIGLARVGGNGGAGSGDIFLAFSTAQAPELGVDAPQTYATLAPDTLTPLFEATAQAVEEAIVNAMVAGRTVVGFDGSVVHALPKARLQAVLRRYGRLSLDGGSGHDPR